MEFRGKKSFFGIKEQRYRSRGAAHRVSYLRIFHHRVAETKGTGVAEENYRREAADNKISSLKNPGAHSRGHLINNDVEEPARRCSLGRKGRKRKKKEERKKRKRRDGERRGREPPGQGQKRGAQESPRRIGERRKRKKKKRERELSKGRRITTCNARRPCNT